MANLPNKSFVFNFNAKNYNPSTYTIPNEEGASMDMDMVWTGVTASVVNEITFDDDHITVPMSAYSPFVFSTVASNPLNMGSGNNSMTIIAKVRKTNTSTTSPTHGTNVIANRQSGTWNWMARMGGSYLYFSYSGATDQPENMVAYSSGTVVTVAYKIDNGTLSIWDVTNNVKSTPIQTQYNAVVDRFCFFASLHRGTTNEVTETMSGDFYWCYATREALTDEEIQQVVEYNNTLSYTRPSFILKNVYRNGNAVRMMFRNGELIYRMIQKPVFEVDKDDISFEDIGGSTTITITANDKWTMTKPEWITASQISGTSTATITLSVSASETQRTGDIVIACDGKTKTISVVQGLDYSEVYLTIEALENGTFYIRASNVGYSINGGEWTNTAGETQLILSNGDKVRLKHSGSVGSSSQGQLANNTIRFKVYGNIMSYNWGDNFIGKTTWNGANYQFYKLFIDSTGLVDASKLILPVTNLIQYSLLCYGSMFYGCTSLRTAPELPSETPTDSCYTTMFYNCSNLNYIKCLATEFTGDMGNWVYGVSPTGTFVKKAGVTWPTGVSGIPSGWTVEDATT